MIKYVFALNGTWKISMCVYNPLENVLIKTIRGHRNTLKKQGWIGNFYSKRWHLAAIKVILNFYPCANSHFIGDVLQGTTGIEKLSGHYTAGQDVTVHTYLINIYFLT